MFCTSQGRSTTRRRALLAGKVIEAQALTHREAEVFDLLGIGASNRQIAQELNITERTVRFHITGILTKLAVTNRAEAAIVSFAGDRPQTASYDTITAGR
ncbi:LuxR family transcriptional regulator [Nonomuraea longispora]|uniref:LuxR family transcriptional regulator n=1 Tax=Nonomuraea longispora TaxID=1848320 RepID=A0A4R4MP11_9ACTN|nr:helix-turn-helix transcriptional regulator [Nonomuraea longispora]TDB96032.1 LuxR family transcriptional regulator [Nonomuraea longispora]